MAQVDLTSPKLVVAGPFGVAETGTTFVAVHVPAKTFVPPYGVSVVITTLLDGGTPSIDIGDGDNTDGLVDTTDITETTAATYAGTETNTAAYSGTGRYYASADTIDCILATGLTAGVFYVYATLWDVEDPM